MYTKLTHANLIAGKESMEYEASCRKVSSEDLKWQVQFNRLGKATASWSVTDGFAYSDIHEMLTSSVTQVFLQQSNSGQLRRQVIGVPMGGKASSELTNLYCYSVESEYIDSLMHLNRVDEAKKWFYTWRYIDDILGFDFLGCTKVSHGPSRHNRARR